MFSFTSIFFRAISSCLASVFTFQAIDPDAEMLFGTKEKAAALASEQSTNFRKNVDGSIQKF